MMTYKERKKILREFRSLIPTHKRNRLRWKAMMIQYAPRFEHNLVIAPGDYILPCNSGWCNVHVGAEPSDVDVCVIDKEVFPRIKYVPSEYKCTEEVCYDGKLIRYQDTWDDSL